MADEMAVPPGAGAEHETDFTEVQALLASKDWAGAVRQLEEMRRRTPADSRINYLLSHARLRAAEAETVHPRRSVLSPSTTRFLIRGFVVVALAALSIVIVYLGVQLANSATAPKPPDPAMVRQQQAMTLVTKGEAYLESEDYETARQAFQAALEQDPTNARATAGLKQANELGELLPMYREAMDLWSQRKYEAAAQKLAQISTTNPNFKDVPQRLSQFAMMGRLPEMFANGKQAYDGQDWSTASSIFETVRATDGAYRADEVNQYLFASYYNQAINLLKTAGTSVAPYEQASNLLDKALLITPTDLRALGERKLAYGFVQGSSALKVSQYESAIGQLRVVYDINPDYASGAVAQALYDAYIGRAGELERREDLAGAANLYRQAGGLKVSNPAGARDAERRLALRLTPTATPTPAPTATPPSGPQLLFAVPPSSQRGPTPTTTATPNPSKYLNKIIFKGDCGKGEDLFAVNPDGSGRQQVEIENRSVYDLAQALEAFAPDHSRAAIVRSSNNATGIWIQFSDGTIRELHAASTGVAYDPVWSPTWTYVAYVSQEDNNDEIYIANADTGQNWRLTQNAWPWDKHPTWSPDGKQIVFWSNRDGGAGQIYIMNADGSQQRPLVRSQCNDTDPIWVKSVVAPSSK